MTKLRREGGGIRNKNRKQKKRTVKIYFIGEKIKIKMLQNLFSLIIFSWCVLHYPVSSMRSSDVCTRTNDDCNDRLAYICGDDYCTKGPDKCQRFLDIEKMIKFYRLLIFLCVKHYTFLNMI